MIRTWCFAFATLFACGLLACIEPAPNTCDSDDDCFTGYACDISDTLQCLPECNDTDKRCLDDHVCAPPPADNPTGKRVCRFDPTP